MVTPSRAMEDERLARRLTPAAAYLHMGSDTWFMYGVGQAGTCVLVRTPHDGPAPWAEAGQVLGSALPDDLGRATRPRPPLAAPGTTRPRSGRRAHRLTRPARERQSWSASPERRSGAPVRSAGQERRSGALAA